MGLTFDAILITTIFIFPGYLANKARRHFVIRSWPTGPDLIFESLIASTILYILGFYLVLALDRHSILTAQIEDLYNAKFGISVPFDSIKQVGKAFGLFILASLFCGGLYGIWQRHDVLNSISTKARVWKLTSPLIQFTGLGSITHWHSEWDRLFHEQPEWIAVTLNDGSVFRGQWCGSSHYPEPQEILLRNVTVWNKGSSETKDGESLERYTFIWLPGTQIKFLCAYVPHLTPPYSEDESLKAANALIGIGTYF